MALSALAVGACPGSSAMPEAQAFSAQTRLLVVAPHPDDETIATGLLIQRVRAAGGEAKILLLTAGDNNPWPQRWIERRVRIGAVDRQRWGQRRHAELKEALRRLDVPLQSLQELGWADMGVTDLLLQAGSHAPAMASLAAAIDAFRPSVIAMPSIDDRHPDHGAAHVLARLALAGLAAAPRQLTYLIHGRAAGDAGMEITGSAGQSANKRQALAAHQSQMALSGRRMRRLASRPERYAPLTSTRSRSDTRLPWRPSRWLRPWLRLSVTDRTGTQSWRWSEAPLRRDGEGAFSLALPLPAPAGPRFARLACELPSPWIFDKWGWCEL